MEKVLNYVAPVVEVVEIEVEKGFAGSITPPSGNEGNPWDN